MAAALVGTVPALAGHHELDFQQANQGITTFQSEMAPATSTAAWAGRLAAVCLLREPSASSRAREQPVPSISRLPCTKGTTAGWADRAGRSLPGRPAVLAATCRGQQGEQGGRMASFTRQRRACRRPGHRGSGGYSLLLSP